jgi:hypothetical protein
MTRRFLPGFALVFGIFVTSGCSKAAVPSEQTGSEPAPTANPSDNAGSDSGARRSDLTPQQQTDWNAVEKLEAAAKAIAVLDGCPTASQCRTAPVGSRACGGPRYYIPWCAKTTDSVALYKKLDEVAAAERAYNTKYNLASTCEMRMPPVVTSSAGVCVVQ